MKTYRVLVTGSRTWDEPERVWGQLDFEVDVARLHAADRLIVVHGACPRGADEHARQWAYLAIRREVEVRTEPHPADWERWGKAAGFIRNQEMVDAGANICLAFIKDFSRGASHCAERAEDAGIPVRRFYA